GPKSSFDPSSSTGIETPTDSSRFIASLFNGFVKPICWTPVLLTMLGLLMDAGPAVANGGTVRTNRAPAGPYAVTVFTSPTPLVVGIADVSTSVERADSGDLEPDARVIVATEPVGHAGQAGVFEATHDQASDANFYAANVRLDTTGTWRFAIQVIGRQGEGGLTFDAPVEETATS